MLMLGRQYLFNFISFWVIWTLEYFEMLCLSWNCCLIELWVSSSLPFGIISENATGSHEKYKIPDNWLNSARHEGKWRPRMSLNPYKIMCYCCLTLGNLLKFFIKYNDIRWGNGCTLEPWVVTIRSRDVNMNDAVIITFMAVMRMCRGKTLWQIQRYASITITICSVLYSS